MFKLAYDRIVITVWWVNILMFLEKHPNMFNSAISNRSNHQHQSLTAGSIQLIFTHPFLPQINSFFLIMIVNKKVVEQ